MHSSVHSETHGEINAQVLSSMYPLVGDKANQNEGFGKKVGILNIKLNLEQHASCIKGGVYILIMNILFTAHYSLLLRMSVA
jgi:hypothetical protein